jgi:hypothetical protein
MIIHLTPVSQSSKITRDDEMLCKPGDPSEFGYIDRGCPQDKFAEVIQLMQCLMLFRINSIKLHGSLTPNPMSGEILV